MRKARDERSVDCFQRTVCGACSLLRTPYGEQLESKRRQLMEALDGIVSYEIAQVLPTLGSAKIEAYRNRAKMTISSDREGVSKLGYFQRRSREVVDAPDCRVLLPEILETTRSLRELLNSGRPIPFSLRHVDVRCGSDPRRQHLTLVVKSKTTPRLPIQTIIDECEHVAGLGINLNPERGAQVVKGRIEPVVGVREVFVEAAGLSLRVSPGSFFQVNLELLPEIHSRMAEFLGRGEVLADLYAGVGTHGLAMRQAFRRVLCVEGVRSSVADAKATIASARVDNVEVVSSPVQRSLRRLQHEAPEAVILNPSREGADRDVLDTMAAAGTRAVAYLSCNPATLARDLAHLQRRGFDLVSLQAIDMMPQTRQVEALALLRRSSARRAR